LNNFFIINLFGDIIVDDIFYKPNKHIREFDQHESHIDTFYMRKGSIHLKNIFTALYNGKDYITKILISSLYILSNMVFIYFSKSKGDISLSSFHGVKQS